MSSPTWVEKAIGRGHEVALLVAVAAALSAGALVGVSWAAGFHDVGRRLLHPHWSWVAAAVAGEVVAYVGYVVAYRQIVQAEGGAELDVPRAAALVTTGFGVFLQGGGFALDRAALQRAGLSERDAQARVLGLGALEYTILAPAAAVAAIAILARGQAISASLTLPWVIGVPAGAAITLTALRFRRRLGGRRGWRSRVDHALEAVALVLRMLVAPRRYGTAFLGAIVYWLGDIACLWATLHVFYATPPPLAPLIVGYATGYAITRRALPLGGAGVVEALLPFSLGWVHIGLAQAVLAVFLYRLINLWLPMVPALAGLPTIARIERGRAARASR